MEADGITYKYVWNYLKYGRHATAKLSEPTGHRSLQSSELELCQQT